jgi:hypothetical protein
MCGGSGGDLFSPSTANNLTYKKYYGVFKNAVSGELRNTFHALSGAAARDHQE